MKDQLDPETGIEMGDLYTRAGRESVRPYMSNSGVIIFGTRDKISFLFELARQ